MKLILLYSYSKVVAYGYDLDNINHILIEYFLVKALVKGNFECLIF